jgi:hypothetical protein
MKQHIKFNNKSFELAGNIYFPVDFSINDKYPTILVTHPEGAVKEQVPDLYAKKMAKLGYVVLTFDGAYMGESTGSPHFTTDPFQRVSDIISAVDYLTTLNFVDNNHIYGLGLCAGGGYLIDAAKTEKRFKAIGVVVPVDMGSGIRESIANKDQLIDTLKAISNQRQMEINGEAVKLTETVAESDEEALKFPENSLFREARSYYRGVGEHPRSTGQQVFSEFDKLLRYDPFHMMDLFWTHPLLAISGSLADTITFAQRAVELSDGMGQLEVIKGATHIDLCYKEEYVNNAIKLLQAFFSKHK